MSIFSTDSELKRIQNILSKYMLLPFSGSAIPGAVMESVLANVREAKILNTYDFVDVISRETRCGWQVKSTKESTPVTWKRAKLPNAARLIEQSKKDEKGLQALGDAIIKFCNDHARASLDSYLLNKIGYARLILRRDGTVTYFERLLCTRKKPIVFYPSEFTWQWSKPKENVKKEQLPALHGFHRSTGKKWWAWHGLGENQLHFSGENAWWPSEGQDHTISFTFPSEEEKLSLDRLIELLESIGKPI